MKNLTRNIFAVIILIAVLSGLFIMYAHYKNAAINTTPTVTGNSEQPLRYVDIASSTLYTTTSGEYPQFTNADATFNQKIATLINKGIAEHQTMSEENWKARFETASKSEGISQYPSNDDKFQYIASTTIVRNDPKIISVVIHIYEYSGGAHGSEAIATFNYDIAKQKEITIEDYILSDEQFLVKLSAISRTKLRTQLAERAEVKESDIDDDMLNDGTMPTKDNFSVFTLPTDNQITFYFSQYQVAAYVFGSSELTLPLPLK